MKRGSVFIFRWISILFLFLGMLLTVLQLIQYSRLRTAFAPGTVIAGVPVAGLDRRQAAERLTQAYSIPVEVRYADAVINIRPSAAGFSLDLEAMLAAADQQRIAQPFWQAFWDFLWNQYPAPAEVPLRASFSEDRLKTFLRDEIAARYDRPSSPASPLPGTTTFEPGQPGTVLDIDRAVILISDAMRNPSSRVVNLSFNRVSPSRPAFQNLQVMLQQVLSTRGFDGLAEIYILDLQTGQEINFAYNDGQIIAPGIAFTAASTMKIPIMVSVFRRIEEPASLEVSNLLESMIELSENDPADRLMQVVLDARLGPLELTSDMQTLGLRNTFLAGYFYPGAPLLRSFTTPANQRTDINSSPDRYNQTIPMEVGVLLSDIYQCAATGGGTLAAVFPGEITQSECRLMISLLSRNRIGVLFQAGLPEGVQLAHKHGWITDPADGLIHTMSDAGIIYTSGGNFVMVVFLYHPTQLLFNPANELMASLAQGVYNYYTLGNP
ncbi:MAG: serine hydrolase [Chloroflexota bacterium]